jgi:hypothetical protein
MWNLRPEERLREWRAFRNQLGQLELDQAIDRTQHLWSYAPYVTHYLADDLVSEWPDPWNLINDNIYCDLAKSLGMLYTLYLCSHYGKDIQQLELRIYRDTECHDIANTVWVNSGKYILNLKFDEVVNKTSITEKFVLKHRYSVKDLQLDLY